MKSTLRKKLWDSKTLMLMSVPVVAFFVIFAYIPMPGVYMAFTNFKYNLGIFASPFVGLRNFKYLFASGMLWKLTRNTILYNLAFIACGTTMQVLVAVLINEIRRRWFKKLSQTLMLLPHFISAVLVGFLAHNILNFDFGFIPKLVQQMGGEAPKFYSSPGAWPLIIVLVNLWKSTGYGSIVYFAAICGIDPAIYEAAEIDGANALQRIWYIILPSLKPTIIILLLFSLGGIVKGNFGLFYNLVGTNALLFQYTDIIETFTFRALLNQFNFSFSAATGLYQSVVGFAMVMTVNYVIKKIEPDYALF